LGKPVGSDLRQGTLTLPVFYYIEQNADGARLEEILQKDPDDNSELDQLIDAIRQSPAIAASKAEARRFVQTAQADLNLLPDNDYHRALANLANYVVERSL
jgi:heptaprenyl diphosphate synthase